jgi:hypothetical protein
MMDAVWFPARLVKNLVVTRDLHRIIERSYRDFPHFENRYDVDEYASVFEASGNRVLRREASGALYPFFALPGGVGARLARSGSRAIADIVRRIDRSEASLMHRVAPMFYLICRRA